MKIVKKKVIVEKKDNYEPPETKEALHDDVEEFLIRGGKGGCKWK